MSDPLQEATRALRSETMAEGGAAERSRHRQTRDRIRDDLRGPERRSRWGFFALPLAAILIGSSAWASGAWPSLFADWTSEEPEPVAASPHEGAPKSATPSVSSASPKAPLTTARSADEPVLPTEASELPAPRAVPRATAAAPSRPPEAARAIDPADAAYRAAHEAHFGGSDPATALRLWNGYLAQAPRGRLSPEAAFNRAVCLVRLGQHDAAIAALRPFAAGQLGGYRQPEAKRLIDALEAKR